MTRRVLFCATVVSHIKAFHIPYLQWFNKQGWEVHVAAHGDGVIPYVDKHYNISIQRSPFKVNNLKAYLELKNIIRQNDYDIIHCHTPMGGVLTRLAARDARASGTKVIYTAHGFHFFTGASLTNWLIYYPVEKLLSRHTDCLITINEEDYIRAQSKKFKSNSILFVHGVGIDFDRFKPASPERKRALREDYDIGQEDFVLIYAAELIKRKNQALLLRVMQKLKSRIPTLKLLLAGQGELEADYKKMSMDMGLDEVVTFLGHRSDMENLYALADIAVSSSRQEGLPVNVMEAIASGLPVVATRVRGNRDLVGEGTHGFLVGLEEENEFVERVWTLYSNPQLRKEIADRRDSFTEQYSVPHVLGEVVPVYTD